MGKTAPRHTVDFASSANNSKNHLYQWVTNFHSHFASKNQNIENVQALARRILQSGHGLVVSSNIALRAALMSLRHSVDFGEQSSEYALLEAVIRYSEKFQIPPKAIMELLAEEPDDSSSWD